MASVTGRQRAAAAALALMAVAASVVAVLHITVGSFAFAVLRGRCLKREREDLSPQSGNVLWVAETRTWNSSSELISAATFEG